jgi:hypothetical protein
MIKIVLTSYKFDFNQPDQSFYKVSRPGTLSVSRSIFLSAIIEPERNLHVSKQ